MKFLALMKDSLREAIDAKVFIVTVVLSLLMVFGIGSISYRELSAEEEVVKPQLMWLLKILVQARTQERPDSFVLDFRDFKQTNEAPEPWNGDYQFDVVLTFETPELAKAFADRHKLSEAQLVDYVEKLVYWLKDLDAEAIPYSKEDPLEVRYRMTSKGTKIENKLDWRYEPTVFFSLPLPIFRSSLTGAVYWIEDYLINGFGCWIGVLVGIVLTSFFVPNMLRKGTVDMLLVKPVHRVTLLVYKYIGGLLFVFLNAVVAVGGVWLMLGLRTGIWAPGFLVSIPGITFFFAILYAVSVLFGVLTRSPIVSIMVTLVVWVTLYGVGVAYEVLTELRKEPEAKAQVETIPPLVYTSVDALHFVLPRTRDLVNLLTKTIGKGLLTEAEYKSRGFDKLPDIQWTESLTVSGVFIAIMLGLACWRFAVKDY